jgi:ATP-dependent DNA ligase
MELTPPVEPMLARLARDLPGGETMTYEPKWDGFRCLAFRTRPPGDTVDLRSRNQRPLARYFPDVVEAIRTLCHRHVVLDGELLVIRAGQADDAGGGDRADGVKRADFGVLMSRLHPAASRVALLPRTTPARFVVFDLLAVDDELLLDRPFAERRRPPTTSAASSSWPTTSAHGSTASATPSGPSSPRSSPSPT